MSKNEDSAKLKEYKEMRKMAKKAGIADLMQVYGEYKRLLDATKRYLQETNPKLTFSTTDSTS